MTLDLAAMWHTDKSKIETYILRRTSDPVLAEDLAAQTFCKASEAQHRGKGPRTSERGWLYRIAHNLIIDHYRQRDRRPITDLEDTLPYQDHKYAPEECAERELDIRALATAMQRLTDDQATVIYMRWIDGYSFGEIARAMGKTEGAVKALQHRGMETLRLFLHDKIT
jgi:RNA polymerase sigma-70 factor (ECF subfamily)